MRPCRHSKKGSKSSTAFSLIELFIVMTILSIVGVLSFPAFQRMLQGSSISYAGESLQSGLEGARQAALARHRTVEVRLYEIPDPEAREHGGPRAYRGFQTFLLDQGAYQPLARVTLFPRGVILSASPTLSTLLAESDRLQPGLAGIRLPNCNTDYQYTYLRYQPDGSTDLDPTRQWFVTLVLQNGAPQGEDDAPPKNFATVQIEPLTGKARLLRP